MKKGNGFIDRLGEKHLANKGYWAKIIEYTNKRNCTIQFEDGTVIKQVQYSSIKKGQIKNPNYPSIYGVGYDGIGKYITVHQGKNTKAYVVWKGMIERCYSVEYQKKRPEYNNCIVISEWHNFQNYAKWYEENYKENFEVDKDILVKGNKIYSPETCCFVPHEINTLFTKSNKTRGNFPIGVRITKQNRYQARISKCTYNKCIGTFGTIEEAFQAYKIAKEDYIKEVADKWKPYITPQTHQAMYNYQVEITD